MEKQIYLDTNKGAYLYLRYGAILSVFLFVLYTAPGEAINRIRRDLKTENKEVISLNRS